MYYMNRQDYKQVKERKPMKTKESIFEVFDREICSKCKKNKTCQEELRRRIDGTVKCYEYERIDKDEKMD